jgi:hypothetical protein
MLFPGAKPPLLAPGTQLAGLPVRPKVPNFFIARTERLRLVSWVAELKMWEHHDFFSRASGVLVTVLDERWVCLHAPTPLDAAYMRDRLDDTGVNDVIYRHWPQMLD